MRTLVFSSLLFFFCLLSSSTLQAQEAESTAKKFSIGPEIQVYPTGIIPGLRLEKFLNSYSSINLRIGYQFIDHRDLGVQDDETGSGYGASLAYRRFFNDDHRGFSLAVRTGIWFNTIDWETDGVTGTTDITVVQPVLLGEYAFRPSSAYTITPSLGFGMEWNAVTDGEPTGEGAILLVGLSVGF